MVTKFQIEDNDRRRQKLCRLLALAGVVLAIVVFVGLPGFNRSYEGSLHRDIKNMGFQSMVMAKGGPYEAATLMLKGGTGLRDMRSVVASIAREPEVEEVTPILVATVFDRNQGVNGGQAEYLGIEAQGFAAFKPFLKFRQGGWFTAGDAYEVVMGCEAAKLEQREAGDMIIIPEKNVQLKVAGILDRTGTKDDETIFLPLLTLQKIFGPSEKIATTIGIKLKKGMDSDRLEAKFSPLLTPIIP